MYYQTQATTIEELYGRREVPYRVRELLQGETDLSMSMLTCQDSKYKHIIAGRKNILIGNRGRCIVYTTSASGDKNVLELFSDLDTAHYQLSRKKNNA